MFAGGDNINAKKDLCNPLTPKLKAECDRQVDQLYAEVEENVADAILADVSEFVCGKTADETTTGRDYNAFCIPGALKNPQNYIHEQKGPIEVPQAKPKGQKKKIVPKFPHTQKALNRELTARETSLKEIIELAERIAPAGEKPAVTAAGTDSTTKPTASASAAAALAPEAVPPLPPKEADVKAFKQKVADLKAEVEAAKALAIKTDNDANKDMAESFLGTLATALQLADTDLGAAEAALRDVTSTTQVDGGIGYLRDWVKKQPVEVAAAPAQPTEVAKPAPEPAPAAAATAEPAPAPEPKAPDPMVQLTGDVEALATAINGKDGLSQRFDALTDKTKELRDNKKASKELATALDNGTGYQQALDLVAKAIEALKKNDLKTAQAFYTEAAQADKKAEGALTKAEQLVPFELKKYEVWSTAKKKYLAAQKFEGDAKKAGDKDLTKFGGLFVKLTQTILSKVDQSKTEAEMDTATNMLSAAEKLMGFVRDDAITIPLPEFAGLETELEKALGEKGSLVNGVRGINRAKSWADEQMNSASNDIDFLQKTPTKPELQEAVTILIGKLEETKKAAETAKHDVEKVQADFLSALTPLKDLETLVQKFRLELAKITSFLNGIDSEITLVKNSVELDEASTTIVRITLPEDWKPKAAIVEAPKPAEPAPAPEPAAALAKVAPTTQPESVKVATETAKKEVEALRKQKTKAEEIKKQAEAAVASATKLSNKEAQDQAEQAVHFSELAIGASDSDSAESYVGSANSWLGMAKDTLAAPEPPVPPLPPVGDPQKDALVARAQGVVEEAKATQSLAGNSITAALDQLKKIKALIADHPNSTLSKRSIDLTDLVSKLLETALIAKAEAKKIEDYWTGFDFGELNNKDVKKDVVAIKIFNARLDNVTKGLGKINAGIEALTDPLLATLAQVDGLETEASARVVASAIKNVWQEAVDAQMYAAVWDVQGAIKPAGAAQISAEQAKEKLNGGDLEEANRLLNEASGSLKIATDQLAEFAKDPKKVAAANVAIAEREKTKAAIVAQIGKLKKRIEEVEKDPDPVQKSGEVEALKLIARAEAEIKFFRFDSEVVNGWLKTAGTYLHLPEVSPAIVVATEPAAAPAEVAPPVQPKPVKAAAETATAAKVAEKPTSKESPEDAAHRKAMLGETIDLIVSTTTLEDKIGKDLKQLDEVEKLTPQLSRNLLEVRGLLETPQQTVAELQKQLSVQTAILNGSVTLNPNPTLDQISQNLVEIEKKLNLAIIDVSNCQKELDPMFAKKEEILVARGQRRKVEINQTTGEYLLEKLGEAKIEIVPLTSRSFGTIADADTPGLVFPKQATRPVQTTLNNALPAFDITLDLQNTAWEPWNNGGLEAPYTSPVEYFWNPSLQFAKNYGLGDKDLKLDGNFDGAIRYRFLRPTLGDDDLERSATHTDLIFLNPFGDYSNPSEVFSDLGFLNGALHLQLNGGLAEGENPSLALPSGSHMGASGEIGMDGGLAGIVDARVAAVGEFGSLHYDEKNFGFTQSENSGKQEGGIAADLELPLISQLSPGFQNLSAHFRWTTGQQKTPDIEATHGKKLDGTLDTVSAGGSIALSKSLWGAHLGYEWRREELQDFYPVESHAITAGIGPIWEGFDLTATVGFGSGTTHYYQLDPLWSLMLQATAPRFLQVPLGDHILLDWGAKFLHSEFEDHEWTGWKELPAYHVNAALLTLGVNL